MTEFVAIPAITVICYFLAQAYKAFAPEDKYKHKHIPVLCGALGGILGVLCYLFITGYIPAENPLVAAAIGLASGWAATGVNQTLKQESGE